MLQETVDLLFTVPDGIYVDCTVGGGGHSAALLAKINSCGKLVCLDQDEAAVENARQLFAGDTRVIVLRKNFMELEPALQGNDCLPVAGIMFDLGVSSPQLDEAERGFSYMKDAPLDMRMDYRAGLTAKIIVNNWSPEELTEIIRNYGEEKWASRIAGFIEEARSRQTIKTTGQLVEIIKNAVPAGARRQGAHPAKRTFQALRIAVNDELKALDLALDQSLDCLGDGGRIAVITFHSLEDRIVKNKFKSWMGRCICPPAFPVCRCGARPQAKEITKKPLVPSRMEIEANPRARSAKLRVMEKL